MADSIYCQSIILKNNMGLIVFRAAIRLHVLALRAASCTRCGRAVALAVAGATVLRDALKQRGANPPFTNPTFFLDSPHTPASSRTDSCAGIGPRMEAALAIFATFS
jgi:hypothetical protein